MNLYESPQLLAEYLLLHYGGAEEIFGDLPGPVEAIGFPTRLVQELLASNADIDRALDLGCAVGGSSFELTRSCREVVGIDYSRSFIAAANRLRTEGAHTYQKLVEGELKEDSVARVPDGVNSFRASFHQGDAGYLNKELGEFDVVVAANLLCRLPEPMRLIERLPSLLHPGAQLLITTPFTWLEEFTPKINWIGGTPSTGRSFEALCNLLEPHFELEHTANLPFLIREHARKFQYGIACGTRWRRL